MPVVFNTSISLVKMIVNALIALMVSCYLLIDKKIISANFKKLIYALFQRDSAALICKSTRECGDILSSFISGKSLDSLIIGILCFVVMNILKLPLCADHQRNCGHHQHDPVFRTVYRSRARSDHTGHDFTGEDGDLSADDTGYPAV